MQCKKSPAERSELAAGLTSGTLGSIVAAVAASAVALSLPRQLWPLMP